MAKCVLRSPPTTTKTRIRHAENIMHGQGTASIGAHPPASIPSLYRKTLTSCMKLSDIGVLHTGTEGTTHHFLTGFAVPKRGLWRHFSRMNLSESVDTTSSQPAVMKHTTAVHRPLVLSRRLSEDSNSDSNKIVRISC